MADTKRYRVKVTEKHVDHVWIVAASADDAKALAPEFAECEFDSVYDCEVVAEEDAPC